MKTLLTDTRCPDSRGLPAAPGSAFRVGLECEYRTPPGLWVRCTIVDSGYREGRWLIEYFADHAGKKIIRNVSAVDLRHYNP